MVLSDSYSHLNILLPKKRNIWQRFHSYKRTTVWHSYAELCDDLDRLRRKVTEASVSYRFKTVYKIRANIKEIGLLMVSGNKMIPESATENKSQLKDSIINDKWTVVHEMERDIEQSDQLCVLAFQVQKALNDRLRSTFCTEDSERRDVRGALGIFRLFDKSVLRTRTPIRNRFSTNYFVRNVQVFLSPLEYLTYC